MTVRYHQNGRLQLVALMISNPGGEHVTVYRTLTEAFQAQQQYIKENWAKRMDLDQPDSYEDALAKGNYDTLEEAYFEGSPDEHTWIEYMWVK